MYISENKHKMANALNNGRATTSWKSLSIQPMQHSNVKHLISFANRVTQEFPIKHSGMLRPLSRRGYNLYTLQFNFLEILMRLGKLFQSSSGNEFHEKGIECCIQNVPFIWLYIMCNILLLNILFISAIMAHTKGDELNVCKKWCRINKKLNERSTGCSSFFFRGGFSFFFNDFHWMSWTKAFGIIAKSS